MFSGIVEGLGNVEKVKRSEKFSRITIDLGRFSPGVGVKDSVAINGTCLTVVKKSGSRVDFDIMEETLLKTNLGSLAPGGRVNVERSLKLSDPIGGHMVQGHVDATGKISKIVLRGDNCRMWIKIPAQLMKYVVEKGFIAVDGISLTVVDVSSPRFRRHAFGNGQISFRRHPFGNGLISVALIPETRRITTLGFRKVGDRVNIEVDYAAKMMEKLIKNYLKR